MYVLPGSKWRKWDLHVHTPASALDHSFGSDWDIYVGRLIEAAKSHQIAAIATADYFSLDGYAKLLDYYNQSEQTLEFKQSRVPLFIIPGIELRLNIFNSLEDSINLHVLFDPEKCSVEFIKQNFLEDLKISYRGAALSLKPQNLNAIGRSIAESAELDSGFDFARLSPEVNERYRREALKVITLSHLSLEDALKEIGDMFERKHLPPKAYLVTVVGKGLGGISSLSWFERNKAFSRAGLVREDLTHQADIVFSNDPNDRKFYLGDRPDTPASEIETRFSALKPCVWGSDSHNLDNLLHPSNGSTLDYTWIKSDVSFEGLKQITYEPKMRVRVQQENPLEEETYARIDDLEIKFPPDLKIKDKNSPEQIPFCIQGQKVVSLAPNLTCVIGGRGSGKSTLVHLLYNLVPDRQIDRLSGVSSPLLNLQLGPKDVLGAIRSLTKSEIPLQTEFFLQNEVEKFAKDIDQMSSLIRSRLYGLSASTDDGENLVQIEKQWKDTADEFDGLILAWDEISRIQQQTTSLKKQKETLRRQTAVINSPEYKRLQDEIQQLAGEMGAFETYTQEHKRVSLEVANLARSLKRLDWNRFEAGKLIEELSAELERKLVQLQTAYESEKLKQQEAAFSTLLNEKKAELRRFLQEKGLSSENIGELATATQQITELDSKIQALEKEQLPHQEAYDRKPAVIESYRTAYSTYRDAFNAVAQKLQGNLSSLKLDDRHTVISFQLRINDETVKEDSASFVKQNNSSRVALRADDIKSVLFGDGSVPFPEIISDRAKLADVVNNSQVADVHTQILKQLINDPVFAEKLHLRMQRGYFDVHNIQVQTKLGDKLLQSTSFGERCGIVIAIALVAGTNPIVIDQPEDNLDGKYIAKVLVPLIREQKVRRQIILVTRDANIVIGGDSELILILDDDGGGIKLLPATIENQSLRPKYIWILDGGEVAFRKREEKYAIPQRLSRA